MSSLSDFLNELQKQIDGDLRTDAISRMLYSSDASIYQVTPHGVLIPKTTDDVQAAVTLAAKYHVPILARTAGTSLAGQAVNEALVVDFTRHLDQILELNVAECWVRVQPGVVLDRLNQYLRPHGLQFGPDPASSNRAAMGGIVSNNSTGSHSIRVGMTADHVLEANVILNDGSVGCFSGLDAAKLAKKMQGSGLPLRRGGSRSTQITQQLHQLTNNLTNQQIISTYTPRHWRRCGGYSLDRLLPTPNTINYHQSSNGLPSRRGGSRFNIAKLICGAEGTLGVITELKLNLIPLPNMTGLAIVQFDDLHEALTAVSAILETNPSAVEMLENRQLTLCRNTPKYARLLDSFIDGNPLCLLITEFYGESESELRSKIEQLQAHLKSQSIPVTAVTPILDPQRQQNVWTVRKGGLGLLMSMKGDAKPIPFIEDSAVPIEHLDEYVTKLEQFCGDLDIEMAYYAHASAGCLHIRPIIDTKKARELAKMPQIAEFAVDLLRGYGGAWSSEHGDGRSRSWLNESFFGPELYRLYRQVKQIFDPDNLFNPGNIVEAGSMINNLRYDNLSDQIELRKQNGTQINDQRLLLINADKKETNLSTNLIKAQLDFSADQGFQRAVEMCNGAGVCRKRGSGTMCPSFMATREEADSTRGRANGLRAALAGKFPLTSPQMYSLMELCVSCKACKSECPSSVDMARIKTEFLAQYQAEHGIPIRNRLFAHIDKVSRLSSGTLAPIVNWSLQNRLVKAMLAWLFGIAPQRTLPSFAPVSFIKWFGQRKDPKGFAKPLRSGSGKQIVLFTDTYHTYNYPQVAVAATELMGAAGFEILLPNVTDCGRPAFSKGMVQMARETAVSVLNALTPFAQKGLPIIFLEPSDLSMLIDDYAALLPNDARVQLVADQCVSFAQFIAQQADSGTLNLTFTEKSRHIILHGHCHQKALIGTAAAHRTLTLPPNYTLEELDTSCCGMAGSFGYEAEHLDISLKMGERRLLPAVRNAASGTLIVASGVSCRQQIKYGTGRRPLHPAEVLHDALP